MLRSALPFLPVGVHLAIVDPGVSAVGRHARRCVAIRTVEEDHVLVGPDNGLLMPAAERFGGVAEAVDIGESPERLGRCHGLSTDATSSHRSPRRWRRASR